MSLFDKLERYLGRFAIPNVSLYLVIGQVFVLGAAMFGRLDANICVFTPELVREGEWWRLITFWFLPPPTSPLFIAFAWYLFWMMGSALEGYWGAFRYNVFLLVGAMLTIGVAFFTPLAPATNAFVAGSVFLAFARLNPDFEMMIFFILPVKIKWLALLTWVGYTVGFILGGWSTRLQILASVGNYLLFFGADIMLSMRQGRRRMARQAQEFVEASQARHTCHVCGKTDRSHPQLDFRYCSKCAGDQCYCPEHIKDHAHVVTADEPPTG
jgi:hypothetical protein